MLLGVVVCGCSPHFTPWLPFPFDVQLIKRLQPVREALEAELSPGESLEWKALTKRAFTERINLNAQVLFVVLFYVWKALHFCGIKAPFLFPATHFLLWCALQGFYAVPNIGMDWESGQGSPFSYFTNGAACTEVEIDTLTGMLVLLCSVFPFASVFGAIAVTVPGGNDFI